jgi:hypothetical protein
MGHLCETWNTIEAWSVARDRFCAPLCRRRLKTDPESTVES